MSIKDGPTISCSDWNGGRIRIKHFCRAEKTNKQTNLQGYVHPKPKLSILYVLSQNYQHCFGKNKQMIIMKLLSCKLKNDIDFSRPSGSWVIDQNMYNNILHVLINNSRTLWSSEILMPFLSFSDNFLVDAYIIVHKSVDNFEIAHKICYILVWGAVPPR